MHDALRTYLGIQPTNPHAGAGGAGEREARPVQPSDVNGVPDASRLIDIKAKRRAVPPKGGTARVCFLRARACRYGQRRRLTCAASSARAALVCCSISPAMGRSCHSSCFRSTIRRQTALYAQEWARFARSCCIDTGRSTSRCAENAERQMRPRISFKERWVRSSHASLCHAIFRRTCACLPLATDRHGALLLPTPLQCSNCRTRFDEASCWRHSRQLVPTRQAKKR